MRLSIFAIAACFLLATTLYSLADEPAKKPTGKQAEAAAAKWIKSLGMKGLVLNEKRKEEGFDMSHAPSALGRVTKFGFQQSGWWFDVVCKGEHTLDTPVKTLQENIWYAALNRIPTPGLELPGWEVRPQTPRSSFKEGVEILEFAEGKLKVRIQTKFFALYGRDPSVLVPADAASPEGSYFQIRKSFPLDLTFEAPVSFKK